MTNLSSSLFGTNRRPKRKLSTSDNHLSTKKKLTFSQSKKQIYLNEKNIGTKIIGENKIKTQPNKTQTITQEKQKQKQAQTQTQTQQKQKISSHENKPTKTLKQISTLFDNSFLNQLAIEIKRNRGLPFTSLIIDKTGRNAYTGSKSGVIFKWDLISRQKKKFQGSNRKSILCLAISDCGKFLASGGFQHSISIWDTQTMKLIRNLRGHSGVVSGLAFSKEDTILYSCSFDHHIKIWNIQEMEFQKTLEGHISDCLSIDYLCGGVFITSGFDKTCRLWDTNTNSHVAFQNAHQAAIDCVKFVNNQLFVAGSQDGNISLWDINKDKPLSIIKNAHKGKWVCSIQIIPNSDCFFSGSYDGYLRIWKISLSELKISKVSKIPIDGFINSIAVPPDNSYIMLAVSQEHRLGRWFRLPKIKSGLYFIEKKIKLKQEKQIKSISTSNSKL
ncbi:u3 small nucleolar RNA-interacting protein [Anaeramoeba flamelloides]|uniref:U3 small nucleolar RNA-interacting protein n=1 Tax=Anaeramoeba flamelloides TaxID=1746091 RepID=A0AAV7ZN00_9EUKA|nr:u3 small nucleolar RNA-interacting protein [Anaeramoeba flamelloides]